MGIHQRPSKVVAFSKSERNGAFESKATTRTPPNIFAFTALKSLALALTLILTLCRNSAFVVSQRLGERKKEPNRGRRMRPQIVLFGDSITEQSFRPGGWGGALADTYSRKVYICFL